MKSFLKVIFLMMMLVGTTQACDMTTDCTAMTEPCEPIDLCAEPCDPIAD